MFGYYPDTMPCISSYSREDSEMPIPRYVPELFLVWQRIIFKVNLLLDVISVEVEDFFVSDEFS